MSYPRNIQLPIPVLKKLDVHELIKRLKRYTDLGYTNFIANVHSTTILNIVHNKAVWSLSEPPHTQCSIVFYRTMDNSDRETVRPQMPPIFIDDLMATSINSDQIST